VKNVGVLVEHDRSQPVVEPGKKPVRLRRRREDHHVRVGDVERVTVGGVGKVGDDHPCLFRRFRKDGGKKFVSALGVLQRPNGERVVAPAVEHREVGAVSRHPVDVGRKGDEVGLREGEMGYGEEPQGEKPHARHCTKRPRGNFSSLSVTSVGGGAVPR
jgi:hypothetical protein